MNKISLPELIKLLKQPLGKRIDQSVVEKWSSQLWSIQSKSKVSSSDGSFVMMLPPPNITGNLHLGHALTGAIQDAIVRQREMSGKRCTWIPGFDHAGLSTQSIVETQLWQNHGKTRRDVGRDKFLDLANEWKTSKIEFMKMQLNRLGLRLSYEREYFTMDTNSSYAVQTAFRELFKSGLIYRATKPVYWSEQLGTTLSDIEVENSDGLARFSRTGEVVERRDIKQWFLDTRGMAHEAVRLVNDGSIQIIPENYKRSWSSWLIENGVQDWCISRQSWWGHRIPAFKLKTSEDKHSNWLVAENETDARTLLNDSDDIIQDPDVLDTWFSSALLPMTIAGWPSREKFSKSLEEGDFPLDIMETGFDILNHWVTKMVMMSVALERRIPFKLILLHGMICDGKGKKMSKSRGNVIDPLDVIEGASLSDIKKRSMELSGQGIISKEQLPKVLEDQEKIFPKGVPKCGADGLRAYLLSHDIQEEVVKIQIEQIDRVFRLSNKIWNIFRFAFNFIDSKEGFSIDAKLPDELKLDDSDKEIITVTRNCVKLADEAFHKTLALHVLFDQLSLFWTESISSGYINDLRKSRPEDGLSDAAHRAKVQLFITCLVTSTKLLYPFMPHLSEFLFQKLHLHLSDLKDGDSDAGFKIRYLSNEAFPKLSDWEVQVIK